MMPIRNLLFAAGIAIFLLAACAPLPEYNKMKTEAEAFRTEKEELEIKLKQAEEKNYQLDRDLRRCEASRDQYTKVKAQNTYLLNINQQ